MSGVSPSLSLTLSEDVLKRAVDREIAQKDAEKEGQVSPAPETSWIGSSLALQVDRRILQVLAAVGRTRYQQAMQSRAWSNLPILNEWKQRYSDRDPVELHQQFWQDRLLCPGGGKYVWNDKWQTMESTVYGCPAEPQEGPAASPFLQTVKSGNFGVTFEEQGLRARVQLER